MSLFVNRPLYPSQDICQQDGFLKTLCIQTRPGLPLPLYRAFILVSGTRLNLTLTFSTVMPLGNHLDKTPDAFRCLQYYCLYRGALIPFLLKNICSMPILNIIVFRVDRNYSDALIFNRFCLQIPAVCCRGVNKKTA